MRLVEIDLQNDSPQQQEQAILEALSFVGFFAVKNSGIPPQLVADMFKYSRQLFDQPLEEKERYAATQDMCGYFRTLKQTLQAGKRDHKESWTYGRDCATISQVLPYPYNRNTHAAETIFEFYRQCHDVSQRLMELFALALGLGRNHFKQSHSFGRRTLFNNIHYPSRAVQDVMAMSDLDIRAGRHQDWGTLTMLFQEPDGQPGLQLFLPSHASEIQSDTHRYDGITSLFPPDEKDWRWFDAPIPPEGGFLVNIGMAMEYWSSGTYKATIHRVIFPHSEFMRDNSKSPQEPIPDRFSIAYFVSPDDEVKLYPVQAGGVVNTSHQALTAGQLVDMKLRESLQHSAGTAVAA